MQPVFSGVPTNIIDIYTHIQPKFLGYIAFDENVTNGFISKVTNLTYRVWYNIDVVKVCSGWQSSMRTEPQEEFYFFKSSQVPNPIERKGKDLEE